MLELKINSPATVIEGESYLVRVAVTNQTFKAGQPCEATLDVVVMAAAVADYKPSQKAKSKIKKYLD